MTVEDNLLMGIYTRSDERRPAGRPEGNSEPAFRSSPNGRTPWQAF